MYENNGLQLLSRIWFVFRANENMILKLAGKIILNSTRHVEILRAPLNFFLIYNIVDT